MAYLHRHRASFGEFGSAQVCARREIFCPRGLKEGIFLEHAEKRVLHSTHRATLQFTASPALVSPVPDPVNIADFTSVPSNSELSVHSVRNIKASDGSISFPESLESSMEVKGLDCVSRVHNRIERIMGWGYVEQEQENSSHVSASFDGSLMLSNRPWASLSCLSKSLQSNYHSTSSEFTLLEALHIPRASAPHISCDGMQQENEFCIEDPEAPSTPDLQPEARAWDCETLCTIGADQMRPTYNICAKGADDTVSGDNPCNKDSKDTEENCCIYMMGQTEESANSKKVSKILDSSAHRHCMDQWLFSCLMMISAQSICATPNNKKSQLLRSSRSLQRLMRFLKWEGLAREGDVIFEQLLADVQIFPQVYKPRLIPYHDQKEMEASHEICYSKQLAHKQVHVMVKKYRHHQRLAMKVIVQEQVVVSMPPNLLETENGRLQRNTDISSEMMHDFEQNFAESHGSSSWSQENGSIRMVEEMDDWNSVAIEQEGECPNTCGLQLQSHPSALPPQLTQLLDHSVIRNQPYTSNIRCPNGSIIDEGQKDYIMCAEDDRHEANCLPIPAVDGPSSLTLPQCNSNLGCNMKESKSSMLHGGVDEKQSREKLEHFAEVFLLRRHIIQQQRRAQQAPPYPWRGFCGLAAADKDLLTTGLLAGGKPSPYTYSYTTKSNEFAENRDHEPPMTLTSSVTNPCDVTSSFGDHDNFGRADMVIDIVGLVKYLESHSSQSETVTDAGANSIGCTTHMPFTGGQLVIPNVNALIVTIVAIVVYTKILLEGALGWVGSQTQSKEKK